MKARACVPRLLLFVLVGLCCMQLPSAPASSRGRSESFEAVGKRALSAVVGHDWRVSRLVVMLH